MILIQCLKCGKNYSLTKEQIIAGEYAPIFEFLGEHSAHFTIHHRRIIDREKLHGALKLIKESIVE